VTQRLAGGVVNTDESFESLGESTLNLPLKAEAHLNQLDTSESVVSGAQATSQFSDPRAATTDDPNELGIEAAAFSLDPITTYETRNEPTETRTVVFSADEIGQPEGTSLLVTSYFYLDGFLLEWGDLAEAANPASAQITVRVLQTRAGSTSPVTVLETSLTLSQQQDGTAVVTTTGVLEPDNLVLSGPIVVEPLPGTSYLLTIPELGIPYEYEATVGEEFTLQAEVECRVLNQPFIGMAVGLGVSVDEYVDRLLELLGLPASTSIDIPGLTTGERSAAAKPLPMGQTEVKVADTNGLELNVSEPFCGLLGIESMLVPVALGGVMLCGLRRRG
jgi:hypothetical protein